MKTDENSPQSISARPAMTAAITEETGLTGEILHDLVHELYAKIRGDTMLGPIFAERVTEWGAHLDRMVAFWSSVALMTGQYHGRPVPAHTALPIDGAHFARWLNLFRETAQEVCPPAGATHVIERAERIARSLHMAVVQAKSVPDAVPSFR